MQFSRLREAMGGTQYNEVFEEESGDKLKVAKCFIKEENNNEEEGKCKNR
jgi:hypothetical protein